MVPLLFDRHRANAGMIETFRFQNKKQSPRYIACTSDVESMIRKQRKTTHEKNYQTLPAFSHACDDSITFAAGSMRSSACSRR